MKQVIILSVPYCEPLPIVAPVLLSGCLNNSGIPAKGIDFNIEFIDYFVDKPYYQILKNLLTMGHLIIDQLNLTIFKDLYRFTKNFLKKSIELYQPNWIGLSIFTSESLDFGIFLSYMIRKYWPKVKIIAGGKGLEIRSADNNYLGQEWVNQGIADTVVIGDAETEIVKCIQQNKLGLVIATNQTKEDLDNIPMAAWEDYDLHRYSRTIKSRDSENAVIEPYLTVNASKGCVRKCSFCDVASFWPEYIYRDPVKVADEMIFNFRQTGIKTFLFTDNLINGSISNYRKINQRLVSLLPKKTLSYGGFAIFRGKHQMPEEDFKLAADAGCIRWTVGVESGSEKVRYDMKKKFSNEDLDWSIRTLHKYNINQNWLLMVGYPTETEKDFEETLNLLRKYAHLSANKMITLQVIPTFMLLKNSPLISDPELAKSHGINTSNYTTSMEKFWTSDINLENTFPVRVMRFKRITQLSQDLGYQFGPNMRLDLYESEMSSLEKIYNDINNRKIFPIRTSI